MQNLYITLILEQAQGLPILDTKRSQKWQLFIIELKRSFSLFAVWTQTLIVQTNFNRLLYILCLEIFQWVYNLFTITNHQLPWQIWIKTTNILMSTFRSLKNSKIGVLGVFYINKYFCLLDSHDQFCEFTLLLYSLSTFILYLIKIIEDYRNSF